VGALKNALAECFPEDLRPDLLRLFPWRDATRGGTSNGDQGEESPLQMLDAGGSGSNGSRRVAAVTAVASANANSTRPVAAPRDDRSVVLEATQPALVVAEYDGIAALTRKVQSFLSQMAELGTAAADRPEDAPPGTAQLVEVASRVGAGIATQLSAAQRSLDEFDSAMRGRTDPWVQVREW
jgi:hypothetical protein